MKSGQYLCLVLASVGMLGIGFALYQNRTRDLRHGETSANDGSAQSEPEAAGKSNSNLDSSMQPSGEPADRNLPKAKSDPSTDASRPGDKAPYGTGMTLGSKRLALTRETPLDWIVRCLDAVPEVESMTLDCGLLTPDLIAAMAVFGNVRNLKLVEVGALPTASIPLMKNLRGVVGVEFPSIGRDPQAGYSSDFAPYMELPDLKVVGTQPWFPVDDEFLQLVGKSEQITALRLRSTPALRRDSKVTLKGLNALAGMRQLKELGLTDFGTSASTVQPEELAGMLNSLPLLERLSLFGWALKDDHLRACSQCLARLTYLDVRGCPLTSDVYSIFEPTWSTEELLVSAKFSDDSMRHIACLPHLKRLEAPGSGISDAGLTTLSKQCPTLRFININGCKLVTDGGLEKLGALSLEVAHISDIPLLTELGVKSFAKTARLQVLGISELKAITASAIQDVVANCPTLKYLYIFRCPNVGKADFENIAKRFPEVTFFNTPYRADPLR